MKNHFWIFFLVLILAILAVLFWHRPVKPTKPMQTTILITNAPTTIISISDNPPVAVSTTSQTTIIQAVSNSNNHETSEPRELRLQKIIEGKNVPIYFQGRVVDQDGQPISNVHIVMSVRHPEYAAPESVASTNLTKEALTDSDGRFEWTDGTGDALNVETITKKGYRLSPKTGLNYGVASGSFENPVIFKMWKLGESQKLISHSLSRVGVPIDGQSVQFDLFSGLKVPSAGQLIIRFERNPQILSSGDSRYDWAAEIEIPSGGLIESNDEFMYEAPENGYQEIIKVEMSKTAEGWKSTLDQSFYIQLENGKYFGSLTIHLLTFHSPPPIVLTLDMTINPNGSRNLQP